MICYASKGFILNLKILMTSLINVIFISICIDPCKVLKCTPQLFSFQFQICCGKKCH